MNAFPELTRVLINNAIQAESSKHLQADEYERRKNRKGHANGYKPKKVRTRIGEITLAVPQVQEGRFYPSTLEKGLRSVRAPVPTLGRGEAAAIARKNSTTETGLAGRTAAYPQKQGFNATEANADQISSLTTTFAFNSKPNTIAFLANLMNVASTNIYYSYSPSVRVDIVINLGRDWAYTNPLQ